MRFVRLLQLGPDRTDRELGRIVWTGRRLDAVPSPGADGPRAPGELSPVQMLHEILATEIVAPVGGKTQRLTVADGPAFLEGLRFQYRGPYLRATRPEGDDASDDAEGELLDSLHEILRESDA
jgi:hypothetical protein